MLDDSYRGQFFDLQALKKIFQEAEEGDMESVMFLAAAFHEDYFSPGLSRYASKWCEKGAEAGNVNAMLSIGSFYRWGEGGVFADAEKALYWYGKAAEQGDEDAIRFMEQFGDGASNQILEMSAISGVGGFGAKWYRSKWMVEQWYEKADSGDAECQYELGRQLMPGTECGAFRRNTKESIRYYEMAAAQGVVDAMFNLANAYQTGWSDLEPDAEKELYWRRQAADAGDVEASYLAGKMLIETGISCVDFDEGIRYLRAASESPDASDRMKEYAQNVSRLEKIYQENKERIVPVNSDFYPHFEGDDKKNLQKYINLLMYDVIAGMENQDGVYVLGTYTHIVTLVEFAVRQSEPVVKFGNDEHSEDELDYLVRRFLCHYLESIKGEDDFYRRLGNCTGLDEKKHRQACHKSFWSNLDNSIRNVQKDYPDFMEGWIFGWCGE